ncbi:secreted phosphoprotein 24-like isoform X2 [Hemiscyllium ocellatum]|uniref:secreted phosphoprotein 24-like isoform X2 n=1 Tax=Hemiscyllium ocellatum TaxID=170820 RepID=UPI002966E485|nr:secreted phosphoprotein 24-like isoform X2 [Hemiscyllium ocellatum]
MKAFLLTIAAVQILHCSGIPSPKDALRASVIKLNEITETSNLCGITRRRVKNIQHTGKLSYNVDLTFSVKETVCSKNSGLEFDDPSCHFRLRKAAERGLCKSHVAYFADEVVDIDVECRGLKTVDSNSDSSESSENSVEVKTQPKPMSIEESPKVKSESTELSLEDSPDVRSKSSETSLDTSSNEYHEDSRSRH